MAGLSDILKMLPIDDIATQLGVDPSVASQAVEEGSATILGGLAKNAQTEEGASAIEKALSKHSGQGDTVDVKSVDAVDGGKILNHIFGDKTKTVEKELTDSPKTAGIDFGKLLPMLAPIIMGMLSKNQGQSSGQAQGGGGITDVIGGLLSGGDAATGGIGDLLSGVLGGGNDDGKKDGGPLGGITDLLGGLFGGKK
ncbi:DUF937 domain-containing protein [Microbacterium mitrae]|uniref:DUF937 domain-containing protein n=1 Tax=Microbacterium mitrae TaxID=664640 RepID=A0A5C8HLF5_9MICO|nr:DUF937 domain-containing protein [Microbacterium mitrae]TXK04126.1 DUF937 domain-containing protein [Microbacterium mitrae]